MDTDVDVIVVAAERPLAAFHSVQSLFERQEDAFSRFRPTSLLSRLNGGDTIADGHFATAVRLALDAHQRTAGAFNPMVLEALAGAGYDRTFSALEPGASAHALPVEDPLASILVQGDSVRLGAGQLDLGGIVKGWTVDLAVALLAELGHAQVLVNAGGDLHAAGAEPGVEGWNVAVSRHDGGTLWEGPLRGGLATSSTLKRRWTTSSGSVAHHLIDPATGAPATSPFVHVTAWAARTWEAEVWAKALLIRGEPLSGAAAAAGVRALALTSDGSVRSLG